MVGEKIKEKRKEKGLTLKELSDLVDISVSFLSDIENGRSNPSLIRLQEIAGGLDCTVSYLLGEECNEQNKAYCMESDRGTLKENLIKLFIDERFIKIFYELEGIGAWTEEEVYDLYYFLKIANAKYKKQSI